MAFHALLIAIHWRNSGVPYKAMEKAQISPSGGSRWIFICGLLAISSVFPQTMDRPLFEVASIKPAGPDVQPIWVGPRTGDPGRIVWSRISLRFLIGSAYPEYLEFGLPNGRISGPSWLTDEYAVTAKIPAGSTQDDVTQMLQNLVAERFGLKFHEHNQDVAGFELIVGQSGFKLTPSARALESTPSNSTGPTKPTPPKQDGRGFAKLSSQGGPAPFTWFASHDRDAGGIRVSFNQCSMKCVANMLSSSYGDNSVPVVDKTGIEGVFDFHLVLPIPSVTVVPPELEARFPNPQGPRSDVPEASVVDLRDLSGSLEKQTGLRLRATRVTLRGMVIDSVARTPTEN